MDAMAEKICEAITNRRVIRFNYKNKPRAAEPYICGMSAAGRNIMLEAF
jgi:hypothetical protein